jgi:hypothetical protein
MLIYIEIFVMYLFTRGFSLRRDIGCNFKIVPSRGSQFCKRLYMFCGWALVADDHGVGTAAT